MILISSWLGLNALGRISFPVKLIIGTCSYVLMHVRWGFPPIMGRVKSSSPFVTLTPQSNIPDALSLSMDPLHKALFS